VPVAIVLGTDDSAANQPCVRWAVEQLRSAFSARGITAQVFWAPGSGSTDARVHFGHRWCAGFLPRAGQTQSIAPETLILSRGKMDAREVLTAAGSDARGLTYALLELADRVSYAADPLTLLKAAGQIDTVERPANTIRSIARTFVSDVEDKAWFQDRGFWERYLTMLVTNRFNRFHLMLGVGYDFTTNITDCYFHFAYPFLLSVPGYNVRAVPLPDVERDSNLEMLRFISDEAARRGLHFQLGLWTHAYQLDQQSQGELHHRRTHAGNARAVLS